MAVSKRTTRCCSSHWLFLHTFNNILSSDLLCVAQCFVVSSRCLNEMLGFGRIKKMLFHWLIDVVQCLIGSPRCWNELLGFVRDDVVPQADKWLPLHERDVGGWCLSKLMLFYGPMIYIHLHVLPGSCPVSRRRLGVEKRWWCLTEVIFHSPVTDCPSYTFIYVLSRRLASIAPCWHQVLMFVAVVFVPHTPLSHSDNRDGFTAFIEYIANVINLPFVCMLL